MTVLCGIEATGAAVVEEVTAAVEVMVVVGDVTLARSNLFHVQISAVFILTIISPGRKLMV